MPVQLKTDPKMKSSFVFVSLIFYFILYQINCESVRREKEIDPTACINGHEECSPSNKCEPEDFIVGGVHAEIEEFPWIVSLMKSYSHHCGGSIVTPNRVVTAAHCTFGDSARLFKIRAGSTNRNEGGDVVSVSEIVNHARYNKYEMENDISILFLDWPLQMSSKIRVIGLPKQDQHITDGTNLNVAGWGNNNEHGSSSVYLMAATIPAIKRERCAKMYEDRYDITDSMICAGFEEGGVDSCQGDSGGPCTLDNNTLIGIVSWGLGCARPNRPGVYTNVAYFANWIVSHL